MSALHAAVLGAFYNERKGGVVVSCGDDYMLAIEFYGPHGSGGVEAEMVFVDKEKSAQAVVRKAIVDERRSWEETSWPERQSSTSILQVKLIFFVSYQGTRCRQDGEAILT